MKKIIIILVAVLVPLVVLAGTITLSWVAPTTYVDGTALSLSEISMYQVGYGTSPRGSNASYPNVVNVANPNTSSVSYTLNSMPSGTYYASVRVVSTKGGVSDWAAEVSKFVPAAPPSTVTNLSIVTGFGVQL